MLLLPATVFAQASLTGTVRDASGAVLPGVTVEAASPALIEKVRTAITDGTGQYRIVDLRPGTYTLTFTLPGFNTVRREDIELTGSQTLTIPADMRVGGIEETITVTGETPVVDVQSARREVVIDNDLIQTIPASRAGGRAAQRDARADGGRQRHRAVADDDVLLGQRRRQQRRPHGRQRHDRWRGAQRRRVVVRLRRGRRRRSRHPRRRRPRRDRHRRPDHEHRPALGRQHLRGHRVHEPRRRLVARQQPERRAARRRA